MPGGAILPRYSFFFGPVSISPSEKSATPQRKIQPFCVMPATTMPAVATNMPPSIALSVRILATAMLIGTTRMTISAAFRLSMFSCFTRSPCSLVSVQISGSEKVSAMSPL